MPEPAVLTRATAANRGAQSRLFACTWRANASRAAWMHLAGDLIPAALPQLGARLRAVQLGARLIVVDLRELAFIDSSGVRALTDAAALARRRGHSLMLVRGPVHVDRVFALTGGAGRVSIFDLALDEPAPALGLV